MLTVAPGAQPASTWAQVTIRPLAGTRKPAPALLGADNPHHPGGRQPRGKLVHVVPPTPLFSGRRLQTIFT